MANQDDGFLREVEEELRRERLEKIWRQYGTYFIAAAALIVVGVFGFKYWESQRNAAAETSGATYEDALVLAADNKEGSAAKEFEKIAQGSGGYAQLARLQLAGALLKDGKNKEAFAAYEELAKDSNADELLRGYARLQAAALSLDDTDFTQMQNRLNPLVGDDSPWRYSARELLGLAAFKAGKMSEARLALTPLLIDQKTPQTVISRAQIVLAEIAAGELEKKSGSVEPPKSDTKAAEGTTTATDGATAAGGTPSESKKE